MGLFAVGFVGLVLLAMGWQPGSSVVLLPDADGNSGTVVVTTEAGQQPLSTAFGRASVGPRGAIRLQQEDPGTVAGVYARTLAARPPAPVSFVLYFEFGSAVDITPAFKPVLDQLLAALPSYPAPEVTVIGHTDRVGSVEFNDLLSLQRAETVRDLIVKAGVQASIEVSGRGEREPLVPTADEEPNDRNRRVEINLR